MSFDPSPSETTLDTSPAGEPVAESLPWAQQVADCLPALRRLALCLCGNPAEADDLVQQTALRALRYGHQLRSADCRLAWMQQVMRRECWSRARARGRGRRCLERFGSESPQAYELEVPILMPSLRELWAALPESFAQAVHLVDLQGYAYKDAAGLLGVPVGTVMSRVHRGRSWLRQHLAA